MEDIKEYLVTPDPEKFGGESAVPKLRRKAALDFIRPAVLDAVARTGGEVVDEGTHYGEAGHPRRHFGWITVKVSEDAAREIKALNGVADVIENLPGSNTLSLFDSPHDMLAEANALLGRKTPEAGGNADMKEYIVDAHNPDDKKSFDALRADVRRIVEGAGGEMIRDAANFGVANHPDQHSHLMLVKAPKAAIDQIEALGTAHVSENRRHVIPRPDVARKLRQYTITADFNDACAAGFSTLLPVPPERQDEMALNFMRPRIREVLNREGGRVLVEGLRRSPQDDPEQCKAMVIEVTEETAQKIQQATQGIARVRETSSPKI